MMSIRTTRIAGSALDAIMHIAPDMRAYVVRGQNLEWEIKRWLDGALIVKNESRSDAKTEAESMGYLITNH